MKMDRIRREIRLHRRLFREDRAEIAEDNMRTLLWTSLAALFLFLIMCMITPIIYKKWELSGAYYVCIMILFGFACCAGYMVKNSFFGENISKVMCGMFYLTSIFLVTLIDTIPYPNGDAVYYPIVIVVLPTLFTFRYHIYIIFSLISEVLYILCVLNFKASTQWNGDIFVSVVSLLFAFTVAWIVLRIRTKDKDEKLIFQKMSTTDMLTGVYNKVYSEEKAQMIFVERDIKPVGALLIIDIDDFKNINDTCGHHIGDMALIAFSDTLKAIFSDDDLIGRIGGDEFLVVIQSTLNQQEIIKKCQQLNQAVGKIDIEECIPITCSIGTVMCEKSTGLYNQIFAEADKALYRAKSEGKNRHVIG